MNVLEEGKWRAPLEMGGLDCQELASVSTDKVTELFACRSERRRHRVGGAVPGNGMHMFGRVRKEQLHSGGGTMFSWRGVKKNHFSVREWRSLEQKAERGRKGKRMKI